MANWHNLGDPPAYSQYGKPQSRWNPLHWGWKKMVCAGATLVIILIIIIAAAVTAVRNNRYPNYSKLNYSLKDTYSGLGFFDNFDYYTGYDPALGFVHYVDAPGSAQLNLTYASSETAVLRVDTSDTNASTGRKSARVSSKKTYDTGLFVFDVLHSPYGCATWPALWVSDTSNWPYNGEIDVMEAVNTARTGNQIALHTSEGCTMGVKRKETGKVLSKNCWNETNNNGGCAVQGPVNTFGEAFNANGGGIYAMEVRTAGIRVWFFERSSVPADITAGTSPDPFSWPEPLADFPSTDCNINNHFKNMTIIANIDLCGQWAGEASVYADTCPGLCTDQVANNATGFDTAYWEFASFKVYSAS